MSSPERNKVTSGVKETVSLPAILTVQHDQKDDPTVKKLDNSGISDKVLVKNSEMGDDANKLKELKKVTLENQKIIKETIKLARKNQTSLEINSQLHLANLQAQNQKLVEEVLLETNTLLATQSEIYAKILEANKSQEAIPSCKSVDTNCVNTLDSKGEKLKEKKRSLEHEEISDKKVKKVKCEKN